MMAFRHNSLVLAGLGILFYLVLVLGDVPVCPKCGYENAPSATVCSHCKAELKPSTETGQKKNDDDTRGKVPGAGHVFLPSGKLEYLDPATVVAEVKLGDEHQKKNQVDVARYLFLNAANLLQLARRDTDSAFAESIVRRIGQCQTQGRLVEKECPVCSGSGKRQMKVVSLKGEVSFVNVDGKSCPRCSGTGFINVPGTIQDWKFRISKALDAYTVLQQARKFVRVGGAWMPAEIDGKLSLKQIVVLRQAAAAPCPDCAGIGRVDCRKCNGLGEVKCTNRGCQRGMVTVEMTTKLTEDKMVRTEKCPVCQGKGGITCEACKGEGTEPCLKCGGTGKRAVCSKCGGEGTMDCRRCRGEGSYKGAVCPTCNGEKMSLCASCNGDGRKP